MLEASKSWVHSQVFVWCEKCHRGESYREVVPELTQLEQLRAGQHGLKAGAQDCKSHR